MTQVKIQAGATFETTSPKETGELLDKAFSAQFQEMMRGIKPMRFAATGTVESDAVTIPQAQGGQINLGPEPGFIWAIRRICVYGLATNDVLQIHRTETDGSAFMGQLTAAVPFIYPGSCSMLIYGGEFLTLTGSSLAATGQLIVNGEAVEAPAFLLGRLVP
jgi:hypothetical protein